MFLQDVKIVLCRVSESGNVGAVCRAMKNMGLSELRLAAPLPLEPEKIEKRAVHAADIWKNARFFDTLADSVADCSIVVGTTRRRGQNRKSVSMPPRALAEWLAERSASQGKAAIIFGNERTGLEDSELALCNFASHIPTYSQSSAGFENGLEKINKTDFHANSTEDFDKPQPSLNLSHAVQVYAYELFLAFYGCKPVKGEHKAMNQTEVSALAASIAETLESIGFYKISGKKEQTEFLRDVISRAGLAEREGRYLRDIFVKAARLGEKQHST